MLTCVFNQTEALVIRNAGACSIDCMRSLQVLDAIGSVSAVVVVHHNGAYKLRSCDQAQPNIANQ